MGRSIVYCDKCGQLLREDDFRVGKASMADNRNYCGNCRPATSTRSMPVLPPASKISTSRLPKQPAQESRRLNAISPLAGTPTALPEAPPRSSKTLLLAGGGIMLVVLGFLFVMMSGKSSPPREEKADSTQNVVVTHPPPPVERSSPEERQLEESARTACVKAYEIRSARPQDLAAQWRAFEEAVAASRGSSYAGDAATQLERIRRKFAEEREALDARAQDAMTREQPKTAISVWEGELRRYDVPEWTKVAAQRLDELRAEAERRFLVARDQAVEAKRRGDAAEAGNIRAKVAAWGLPTYAEQIDQALAGVVPEKAPPPAEDSDKSAREREAYVNRWKEMLGAVGARDYAEGVKLLEKLLAETRNDQLRKDCARDLENLKLAAAFIAEAAPLVSKVARGQKLAWSYWDPSGSVARLDDVVLKIDATRVEVKWEEASRVIPFGEIGASTLSDLLKGKSARAAGVAALLEGDPAGAKRVLGDQAASLPDYYGILGREAAESRAKDERECRARSLFYEAERDYFDPAETADAVAKYRTLLAELSTTAFVRRNKAAITARTEGGPRDLFLPVAELQATAGFKQQGKLARGETAWVAQADVDLPKMKENYVEFSFPAVAETETRIWILAGGCCQEVLTFYAQGNELTGPDPANPKEKAALEPGANAGLLVKPAAYSLKKLHSQHNGPKTPERFEWILVASMKYAQAGVKKIRILTNQKGFAVAQAAILLSRPGPPKESDFRELERWKAETPGGTLSRASMPGGSILWEVFRGIPGGSVGELLNAPGFKADKPTEFKTIAQFETIPNIGTDYGSRVRGYIHPPTTGLYVFWLATDDQGELRLSSDEDPSHAKPIATVPEWTLPREYGKYPQQQSAPIELKAGRRYYIEAFQKQAVGGDHLSVGWRLADGSEEKPIPGSRLSPWVRR